MAYIGTLGAVSNQEDWIVTIQTFDDSNNAISIAGATLLLFMTDEDQIGNALVSHSTNDGAIVIAADGLSFTWTVLASEMQAKFPRPANYDVYLRMVLNNVTTQLIAAQVSITQGGPTQ